MVVVFVECIIKGANGAKDLVRNISLSSPHLFLQGSRIGNCEDIYFCRTRTLVHHTAILASTAAIRVPISPRPWRDVHIGISPTG